GRNLRRIVPAPAPGRGTVRLLTMANQLQRERNATTYDWRLLQWIWVFVRPYRRMFWASMVLMPLNTAFVLAQPYMIKLTVDLFLSPRPGHHPPAWLAPMLRAAGSHGLVAMGALYALLLIGDFTTFYGQFYLTMM